MIGVVCYRTMTPKYLNVLDFIFGYENIKTEYEQVSRVALHVQEHLKPFNGHNQKLVLACTW